MDFGFSLKSQIPQVSQLTAYIHENLSLFPLESVGTHWNCLPHQINLMAYDSLFVLQYYEMLH